MIATRIAPAVEIDPFVPKRRLRNGHVMTVYAWAKTREFPNLPAPEARLVRVSEDTEVRVNCYWQPDRARRPVLIALHGLEGSSEAHYMRGLADKAWRRGWNAALINQRNCGGTEGLTPGLYYSALTSDPRAVMASLMRDDGVRRFGIVGYSLGGNLAVRLAGEMREHPELPIAGVVAISPTIDLERCVGAIERRANYPYHWNFIRNIKARMRRKALAWPGRFDLTPLGRIWTIRAFDDRYTAPLNGFAGATDYYYRASGLRLADGIETPTLILSAADDPFVPAEQFREPALRDNPHITIRIEPHGGHCGFVAEARGDDDGYWAERTAVEFLASLMPADTRSR